MSVRVTLELAVIVRGAIGIESRDGTARAVGIINRIYRLLIVLTLVDISGHTKSSRKPWGKIDVKIDHRTVTAVGGALDHIIVVHESERSVVDTALTTAAHAGIVLLGEAVVGEEVEPVGVDGLDICKLAVELLLSNLLVKETHH